MIPDRVTKGSTPVIERLKSLDREQLHAVLATDSNGQPYTSMIAFALSPDGKSIVFATPQKTAKYKNIMENNKVSLLIDTRSNTPKDYMNAESLTVLGYAQPIRRGKKRLELAGVLIRKHPGLHTMLESPRTRLLCITIIRCIHVTRFQTVSEWISDERL